MSDTPPLLVPASALPPEMTIDTADTLIADFRILATGGHGHSVILDASKVEVLSTAAIQLIVALEKSLTEGGGHLLIAGASESFRHAFADLGIGLPTEQEV